MRNKPLHPVHKLVALGDSLVQGFQNGSISQTGLSFPAILARSMHPKMRFDQADFSMYGGLPLNLEMLVRSLEEYFGKTMDAKEWSKAVPFVISSANRIKRYWEGRIAPLAIPHYTPFHNQSIWGATISDSWVLSDEACLKEITERKAVLSAIGFLPDHAQYITARRVLNPSFELSGKSNSALDNVRWFSENGGIENLVVWIGSNNIVGSITTLSMHWNERGDSGRMPGHRKGTVSTPEDFERDFRHLAHKISSMSVKNVFVGTVPYVTLPPLLRDPFMRKNSRLKFESPFLTHPWLSRYANEPDCPSLSREQVSILNHTVDEYNRIIRSVCDAYDFKVVPMNRFVSAMCDSSSNKPFDFPDGLKIALKKNPQTAYLVDDQDVVRLNADYIQLSDEGKLETGGIFSLDGLHPTTIGYGLVAQTFQTFMRKRGVHFEQGIDWDFVVSRDTLINNPPALLSELHVLLRILATGITRALGDIGLSYMRESKRRLFGG